MCAADYAYADDYCNNGIPYTKDGCDGQTYQPIWDREYRLMQVGFASKSLTPLFLLLFSFPSEAFLRRGLPSPVPASVYPPLASLSKNENLFLVSGSVFEPPLRNVFEESKWLFGRQEIGSGRPFQAVRPSTSRIHSACGGFEFFRPSKATGTSGSCFVCQSRAVR